MKKITYFVSREPFKDTDSVFKKYVLPNGTIVKIMNRKIFNEAVDHASKLLKGRLRES